MLTSAQQLALDETYLAANSFSWLRATDTTSAGANVGSFVDRVNSGVGARAIDPAHNYSQATALNQVLLPVNSATFNNLPTVAPTGPSFYQSSLPASGWQFTSNGTGFQSLVIHTFTGGNVLFGTTASGVVRGITCYYTTATTPGFAVYKTGGGVKAVTTVANPSAGLRVYACSHSTGTPNYRLSCTGATGSPATGSYDSAPEAGDPQYSMGLMSNIGGAFGFTGLVSDYLFNNNADPVWLQRAMRYALLRYGAQS